MRALIQAILVLVLAGSGLPVRATAQRDVEVEKIETTYRFNNDGTGSTTTRARWKALTSAGLQAVGRFSFPYVASFDSLRVDYFRTLKTGGSVVDGDPRQAFDTTPPMLASAPVFSDVKQKNIVLPNVEIGDSVEYQFVVERRQSPKPGDFFLLDAAATNVAVNSEIVVLDLPADRKIALHESRPHTSETEANGRRILRWEIGSREPGSPLDRSSEPTFAASTILSWDELGAWYRTLNEPAQQVSPEIQALAAKLTAGKTTARDRIEALYAFVAGNIRYVGISFGIGFYQPHRATEVLRNGYGDCKDKHVLLVALLRAVGIEADAVLTSPGVGVLDEEVPMPIQFTHEFTSVQTKSGRIFLDTTLEIAPLQLLTPGVRGHKALLVGESRSSLIDIPPDSPVPHRRTSTTTASVDDTGKLEGTIRVECQGNPELETRRLFRDGTPQQQEEALRQLSPLDQRAAISDIHRADPRDLGGAFWFRWTITDPAFLAPGDPGKRITLHAGNLGDLNRLSSMAPPSRPLPLEKAETKDIIDLAIPAAYTMSSSMPFDASTPSMAYRCESSFLNGRFRNSCTTTFTGAALLPADWQDYLAFVRRVEEVAREFVIERRPSVLAPAEPSQLSELPQLNDNAAGPQPIRIVGSIEQFLVTKVTPAYPTLAKQARVQGLVRMMVVIGRDGHVQSAQLVSGHPLLVEAAMAAVKRWVYRPFLVNGVATDIVTELDVVFQLQPD